MSPLIGALISSGKASLHELDTVYSVRDAYIMLEVITVDAANRRTLNKAES